VDYAWNFSYSREEQEDNGLKLAWAKK
jgi:hypothetical protein